MLFIQKLSKWGGGGGVGGCAPHCTPLPTGLIRRHNKQYNGHTYIHVLKWSEYTMLWEELRGNGSPFTDNMVWKSPQRCSAENVFGNDSGVSQQFLSIQLYWIYSYKIFIQHNLNRHTFHTLVNGLC